ncbi:sulfotransferase domain-containing protein [Candidatus Acetothermia bacterium]|nr:sulfotransferase domain-containing protein [Candidatus Acetothermia bacterium]MBI3643585.1 sulfotransferase domain-containing protein [Candidatus Acetothermia bacterium]
MAHQSAKKVFEGRVSFCVGTGRCGTTFLSKVIELEPQVASSSYRHALSDTFHRYCNWHNLPVDSAGFLQNKEIDIVKDLQTHRYSFESSSYLSLSIQELFDHFKAKFILLVRSPANVVNSYLSKDWYANKYVKKDPFLALGYQQTPEFHHFLGRITPIGDDFTRWNELTQVGKVAWYWSTLNSAIIKQFRKLPETYYRVQKLEELDYSAYRKIADFLGFHSTIPEDIYNEIAAKRPNARTAVSTISNWSSNEILEFEHEVAPVATQLGYEYQISSLLRQKASTNEQEKSEAKTLLKRTNGLSNWLAKVIRTLTESDESSSK